MEHIQIRLLYFPKKESQNAWQTTSVDLSAYTSTEFSENLQKKEDTSQISFVNKVIARGKITSYSSNVFTVTGNYEVNALRWHSFIDSKGNRFVIASNTSNTITLSTDYTFPVNPTSSYVGQAYSIKIPTLQMQDIIQIYSWTITDGSYAEPANLLDKLSFNGQVTSWKYSENAETVLIKLGNLSELLMKSTRQWATDITGSYPKCFQKIQDVINWVNQVNLGAIQIRWASTNPVLKRDGSTAFPDKDYYSDYRSGYDVIYQLCQDEYTEDGEYYFYLKPVVDSSTPLFDLIWMPKLTTVDGTYDEVDDFKLISYGLDSAEVVSMLSIRCGDDARGSRISTFVIGDLSNGGRGRPVTKNFAGDIITKEVTTNYSNFDTTLTNGSALFPTSYPYTTATIVTTAEANTYPDKLTAGTYTATEGTEYNNWIRWLAKARAKLWGSNYINLSNRLLKNIKVRFYNTPLATTPGTLDKFNIPSIGFIGGAVGQKDIRPKLRLTTKTVSIGDDGVYVDCSYVEDAELVTA